MVVNTIVSSKQHESMITALISLILMNFLLVGPLNLIKSFHNESAKYGLDFLLPTFILDHIQCFSISTRKAGSKIIGQKT